MILRATDWKDKNLTRNILLLLFKVYTQGKHYETSTRQMSKFSCKIFLFLEGNSC